MGLRTNLSSTLLLLPLVYHHATLTQAEKAAFVNLAFVSALFHSMRERDMAACGAFGPISQFLYKLDHANIHIGLAYLLTPTYATATVLLLELLPSASNASTAALSVYHLVRTIYHATAIHMLALAMGLAVAKHGYRGTNVLVTESSAGTSWSEWHKCMWHGGMGVVLTVVMIYRST